MTSRKRSNRYVLFALSWYSPELHRGVTEFARDHSWHLVADADDMVPKHWDVDGVITHLGANQNLWRSLRNLDVPIVDLSESRPQIRLPRVTMDNTAIGKLAAQHFLDRGYHNVAFVHRWELGVSYTRRQSFAKALKAAGRECHVLTWQKERGQRADTRTERHRWLVRRIAQLPKPLAVFATRDSEAVEVIEACLSSELDIPEQVAVLGVDNTEAICECLSVALSSIDSNLQRVGYEGAALLDRLMSGKQSPKKPRYIAPKGIVARRSTDSLAVAHPEVNEALRFIQEHYSRAIGVAEIARAVSISRSGLEQAFREHFVRPPGAQLRRVRLDQVKRMLTETDETIVAIANATGFQTAQNLCRAFKRETGMSPRRFRHDDLDENSAKRVV